MVSVYKRKTDIGLGPRRVELLQRYQTLVNRGREDPAWFIETFFDVKLLDYQKWMVNNAWTKKTVVFLCSRNTGKSFISGLYMMARALLFPSSKIWIMSGNASQAQDTFTKIEDLAKHNITSVKNDDCIFLNEILKGSNGDGFVHKPDSYSVQLYNGSTITTLVGRAESIVGKRSDLSVFDEAGIMSRDFFVRTEPFTTQSKDFVTGEGIDLDIYPQMLPTQNLYLSSAGDTNGRLWEVYKDCAKRMMMGFDDCFVADIGCDIPLNPTMHGKKYAPLFDKSKVDSMMRTNPYRALREYYNIFDQIGGTDMVIGRDVILRNEKEYLPVFSNLDEEVIYGLFYDPALQADNSFCLIAEYRNTKKNGWVMRLVNGINLLQTLPNGDKKPMRSTEQLEWIRRLMLKYNGKYQEYEKIHLSIDPGSGGGGRIYGDFLIQEWQDENGNWHHGVIDENDDDFKQEAEKYPLVVPGVLTFMESQGGGKTNQYNAVQEMCNQDLVTFPKPPPYDGKLCDESGMIHELSPEEISALTEIDLLKEELCLMRKTKTEAGNIKYALVADRARSAHDDRAFTFSMACYYLFLLRRKDQYDIEPASTDMSAYLQSIGKKGCSIAKKSSPFSGKKNAFKR